MVLVGEDPASQVYVKSKGKAAQACGFHSVQHDLPATTTQAELIALVDASTPIPPSTAFSCNCRCRKAIDSGKVLETVAPEKDVDGFHPVNVGLLATALAERALVPCTPAGAMLLLEEAAARRWAATSPAPKR